MSISSLSPSLDCPTLDRSLSLETLDMGHSKASFTSLPSELRCEIYCYLRPNGLWHEYWLDLSTGHVKQSRRQEQIPPLFQSAKWILDEAMSFLLMRNWRIRILHGKVMTNFPLDQIQLSLCEKLSITVERPPSPRKYEHILETRRTVDIAVNWINSYSPPEKMHGIEVRLGARRSDSPSVWNDYAMLIGPLSRLKRSYAPVHVERRDIWLSDIKSRQQCDFLESVLSGKLGPERQVVDYQQATLDLRVLNHRIKQDRECHTNKIFRRSTAPALRGEIDAVVWRLASTYVVGQPAWLLDLHKNLVGVADDEAVEIFTTAVTAHHDGGAAYANDWKLWMTGLLVVGFDPLR